MSLLCSQLLVVTLTLLCGVFYQCVALSDNELLALEDFFVATNGGDWDPLCEEKWRFSSSYASDPCLDGWHGVTCNTQNTSVKYLELSYCQLQGTIPSSLSILKLHTLNVSNNAMQGTIPDTVLDMTGLRVLDFSYNQMIGTLPTATRIRVLNLYDNSFWGTIPSTWSQLTGIEALNISKNQLTGSIPDNIGSLSKLWTLDLSENMLNGTIPFDLFKRMGVHLNYLALNNNQLTGTLHSEVYRMDRLSDLDVSHNFLSGEIPGVNISTRRLPPFRHIYLADNHFTSTIPSIFAFMNDLVILDLSTNLLGGPIPNLLFDNDESPLKFVYFQTNQLRSVIPEGIGHSFQLSQLFLFENKLTGTLPESMLNLMQLETLLLQDNELSGKPGRAFKSSNSSEVKMMVELQILDLSNNLFTGNVPTEIFELPNIRYVSITEGCFEGSIPRSVCTAATMSHLILEGLSSGSDCSTPLWDPLGLFAQGFVHSGGLTGGIPDCLFNLVNLTTLHLSGNGLDGSIPASNEPKQLKDLSLSYNQLTGTLPLKLLQSSYSRFDVSQNKITGTCDDMTKWTKSDTESDSLLNLAFNRLSGEVPTNFQGLDSIDMLDGNIFTCPNRDNDLPRQDPNYLTYICASDDYDEMMLIWGTLWVYFLLLLALGVAIYVTACGCLRGRVKEWVTNLQKWNTRANAASAVDGPHVYSFLTFLKLLRQFTTKLALLIMILFSTLFFMLKFVGDGGTHTYQYRWLTSAAFLSGTLSSSLIIVGLFGVICFTFYHVMHFSTVIEATIGSGQGVAGKDESTDVSNRHMSSNTVDSYFVQKDTKGNCGKSYLIMICGLIMNAIVVLVVNGMYVYVVSWQSLTVNEVFTIQISKSIFDTLWNNVAIRMFMKRIKSTLRIKRLVRLVLAMLLFNSIIAPILSTLVTDSNCFVGMFVDNNEISTTTVMSYCARLVMVNVSAVDFDASATECEVVSTLELETAYVPKFQYNYQCSSSFLSNFIPIFVFTSGSVTFVVPMVQMIVAYFLTHRISPEKLPIVPPGAYFPGVPLLRNPRHHVFSTDMVMAKFLQNITVMLTFGLACPNLAFILGVHVFVMTWYYHLFLGRYMSVREEALLEAVTATTAATAVTAKGSTGDTPSLSMVKVGSQRGGETVNPLTRPTVTREADRLSTGGATGVDVSSPLHSSDSHTSSSNNSRFGDEQRSEAESDISSLHSSWTHGADTGREEEGGRGDTTRRSKHIRYEETDSDDDSDSDSEADLEDNKDGRKGPKNHRKPSHFDRLLEHDCRDIVLAPQVAVWTIIDISAVCTAAILIDVSGDTNGLIGALLTACLPVLCIPLLLRMVHRKYYMLPVSREGKGERFSGADSSGIETVRSSSYSNSNNFQRKDRQLSKPEAETETRYLDDM